MLIRILVVLFLCAFLGISCNQVNKKSEVEVEAENVIASTTEERIVDSENAEGTWEPANESGILFHYVCPDRCVDGVLDYEGACPICGKTLQHNQAYHFNNDNPTETPAADQLLAPRNTAEDPPLSPNGIWHFICPNGHDGGGEAGDCVQCGAGLVHNSMYHTDTENPDEPAQNENGVWHFVCEDGHEGGGGAPVTCDACGKVLMHNPEYH